MSAPVSNAWPERGAIAIWKRIKTRLRSSLTTEMLDSLLQISINGPSLDSSDSPVLLEKAVKLFHSRRKRIKGRIPSRPSGSGSSNPGAGAEPYKEAESLTISDTDMVDVIRALDLPESSDDESCDTD